MAHTLLRFDTEAVAAAATALDEVAETIDPVRATASGVFGLVGATVPPELAAMVEICQLLRDRAGDLRGRCSVASRTEPSTLEERLVRRTYDLRDHLAHLGREQADELTRRLPEADRYDDPRRAVRRSVQSATTVTEQLEDIALFLDRYAEEPTALLELVELLAELPAPPGAGTENPIDALLATVDAALADGDADVSTVDAVRVGIATAVVSALLTATPAEIAELLGTDWFDDGGLADILELLPTSVAAAAVGAALSRPGAGLPPWLEGPDALLTRLLETFTADPDAISDEDLHTLLIGLHDTRHRLDAHMDAVVALLVAVRGRLHTGPGPDDATRLSRVQLQQLVRSTFGTDIDNTLAANLLDDITAAVVAGDSTDDLARLGFLLGNVLDATEDAWEAVLTNRERLADFVLFIVSGFVPATRAAAALAVGIAAHVADRVLAFDGRGSREATAKLALHLTLDSMHLASPTLVTKDDVRAVMSGVTNGTDDYDEPLVKHELLESLNRDRVTRPGG